MGKSKLDMPIDDVFRAYRWTVLNTVTEEEDEECTRAGVDLDRLGE